MLSAVGMQRSAAIGVKYVKLKPVHGYTVHVFAVHLQTIQHEWDWEHSNLRKHADLLRQFKQSKQIPADDIVLILGDFNANAGNKSGVTIDDLLENSPHDDFYYICEAINAVEVRPYRDSLPFSFNVVNNTMAFEKKPLGTLNNILCDIGHVCPERGFLRIRRFDVDENSGLEIKELSDHFPVEGELFFPKRKYRMPCRHPVFSGISLPASSSESG